MTSTVGFPCLIGLAGFGLPVTLAAQTTWTPATGVAAPEILSSGLTPGGFRLEIAAPPGDYPFQRSTTLQAGSWENLDPITSLSGTGEATDPDALVLPKAFYRMAGGFEETAMQLVAFDSTLSSASLSDPEPFQWGGLWTRQSRENLLFQSAQPTSGRIRLLDGDSGGFIVEPNVAPPILTSVEQWDEPEELSATIANGIWSVETGGGSIELMPVEGGNHSLAGIAPDEFIFTNGDFATTERSLETLWVIAKSQNAQPADLAGDWGFVRILSDGIDTDGILDGLIFPATITAGPNPRNFAVNSVTGFEIQHTWEFEPATISSVFYTDNPAVDISLDLAADGGVTLTLPDENPFRGMVSPSAKLMAVASSNPDIVSDPDNAGQDSGTVQWLVGVKRDNSPELAGKTYRILRQGWWVEGDFFQIERGGASDQLVFDATGTSVSRSSQFIYDFVSFDGFLGNGLEDFNLTMNVSTDGQGQIVMESGVPDDFTVKTFGYAQEGSGLLVLVDAIDVAAVPAEDLGAAAGLGLIIAIEEP